MTIKQNRARFRAGLFDSAKWREVLSTILDWIYPPRCSRCGRVDTHWCERCDQELSAVPIIALQHQLDAFDGVMASAHHKGIIQDAIHALKYNQARNTADSLADRLVQLLIQQNWTIDCIIPVPLHTNRLQERGYNQSKLLCDSIAAKYAIPVADDAIARQKATRSQVGLNREERLTNVSDAFTAMYSLSGKRILIVDDVRTTGATLIACAQAARSAGATEVYALTVTVAN